MRRPAPAATALTDQIAAVLRDASPLPVGTHDIGIALGPYRPHFSRMIRCSCGHQHLHEEDASYTRSYHPADIVRPALLRLERAHLVERIPKVQGPRMDTFGHDYWRWIGEQ